MSRNRLHVRLVPNWEPFHNPKGPPTYRRTDSDTPGLLRVSIYAEYMGIGPIPNPTGDQLIDLAKGHGSRQNSGELVETSCGRCELGTFGTASFRSEKWPHAQLWYLSNGKDFVLATLLCETAPDPEEIGEAHGIVLGVTLTSDG